MGRDASKRTVSRGSLADAWSSPGFWTEVAIGEFVRGLRRVLGEMKQKEFAERLGVSESAVSQILKGREQNYSLERMNRIASALGAAVHVHVAPRNCLVTWTETATGPLGELVSGARRGQPELDRGPDPERRARTSTLSADSPSVSYG